MTISVTSNPIIIDQTSATTIVDVRVKVTNIAYVNRTAAAATATLLNRAGDLVITAFAPADGRVDIPVESIIDGFANSTVAASTDFYIYHE